MAQMVRPLAPQHMPTSTGPWLRRRRKPYLGTYPTRAQNAVYAGNIGPVQRSLIRWRQSCNPYPYHPEGRCRSCRVDMIVLAHLFHLFRYHPRDNIYNCPDYYLVLSLSCFSLLRTACTAPSLLGASTLVTVILSVSALTVFGTRVASHPGCESACLFLFHYIFYARILSFVSSNPPL
jgi:hypothetical protein